MKMRVQLQKVFLSMALGALALVQGAMAQPNGDQPTGCEAGWCWGKEPGSAKEKWTIFNDGVKSGMYDETVTSAGEWLLANVPQLNDALYVRAIKMYQDLEAKETDAAKKSAMEDKALAMYDARLKFYGDKYEVLERKATKLYDYYQDRKDKQQEVYNFYVSLIEKGGEKVTFATAYIYVMNLGCLLKEQGKVTDDEIIQKYDMMVPMLEKKIAAGTDADKWKTAKEQVDGYYQGCVKVDCDFVKKNLGPKMQANPADAKLVNQVVAYMLQGKCTADPLFYEALAAKEKIDPNYATYMLLAQKAQRENNDAQAVQLFQKAMGLLKDDEKGKKAELIYEIAKISYQQSKYAEARKLCYQAAETDAAMAKDAYSLIGDMYMKSHSSCKGRNPLENRYVFLAAFDMYAKAGNSKGMANAKEQFPSAEDIFTFGPGAGNVKEGSSVSVGCWIGATSTLRKR